MPRPKTAFSFVELLVILGIIALIISLLLPSLAKARHHAIDLQCAAQLHHLGIALTNYATVHTGFYPPYSTHWQRYHGDGLPGDSPGFGWPELLDPYLTAGERAYDCPDFPPGVPFNYFLSSRWAHLQGHPCLRFSEIRHSSQFFIAAETTTIHAYPQPFGDNTNTTDDCDKDDALGPLLFFFGNPGSYNAHLDGTHLLFADGHVAAFRRFDPSLVTFDPHNVSRDWDELTPP